MKPKRYPYSGKKKESNTIVKVAIDSSKATKTPSELLEEWEWVKAREAFYVSVDQERISALKRLNEATYRVDKVDRSIQQLGSRV
ncbi:hypothetical protein NSQ85_06035 [Streptococcus sp. FSL L8-0526]|uniref:hypothetical protein n=1 Tax=Streptococcus sp. FSL L8-0526 TaxID=2954690 RepID=UPI0030FB3CF7